LTKFAAEEQRIVVDSRGAFFAFPESVSSPVRLVTLNLRWLPDYVYPAVSKACRPGGALDYQPRYCRPAVFREPLREKLRSFFWKFRAER